jgi:hypothetical protein
MLPLGHDATRIIPSAMLGAGRRTIVSANATAGSSTECAIRPMIVPRGADTIPLKSSTFMSSATPNSTKARMTSSAISDSGLKWSRTASISVICPSARGACP